jgi:hypothetical protein
MRFLFIGERRSPTAVRMGVTWVDGHLCAKNLHEALRATGIDPSTCKFGNAYQDNGMPNLADLKRAARHAREGGCVVALGEKAHRQLKKAGVLHVTRLIHPAARGFIRKRERYQEHVATVLGDLS